jgi:hypothetical protein
MNLIKFNCNNCQHHWDGNDFTTECPVCNSGNIEKFKMTRAVNGKWILVAFTVIALLGVTGLLLNELSSSRPKNPISPIETIPRETPQKPIENKGAGNVSDEKKRNDFKVEVIERSQWFYVKIRKYDGLKYISIDPNSITRIINSRTGKTIQHDNGKLLLCTEDEGNFVGLKIYFEHEGQTRINKTTAQLSLYGRNPSSASNCGSPMKSHHIKILRNSSKCTDYIDIDKSVGVNKSNVYISVTGKNGKYQRRWVWNVEENLGDKYDVWVAHKGDTIPAYRTGDKKVGSCGSKVNAGQVLTEIESVALSFGNNPTNSKQRSKLKDLLSTFGASPVCYLNGKQLNGFSQMAIDMKDIYKNNGGSVQFTLKSKPRLLSDNKTIQIEYIEK